MCSSLFLWLLISVGEGFSSYLHILWTVKFVLYNFKAFFTVAVLIIEECRSKTRSVYFSLFPASVSAVLINKLSSASN
jgi:hypothetical protein